MLSRIRKTKGQNSNWSQPTFPDFQSAGSHTVETAAWEWKWRPHSETTGPKTGDATEGGD